MKRKMIAYILMFSALLLVSQVMGQNEVKTSGSTQGKSKQTETGTEKGKTQAGATTTTTTSFTVNTKQANQERVPTSRPPQKSTTATQQSTSTTGKGKTAVTTSSSAVSNAGKEAQAGSESQVKSREQVLKGQKVYDQQGRATAYIDKDGTVRDPEGRVMGKYTNKGEYLNAVGEKVGSIENGVIHTVDGKVFASINNENGRVYDGNGKYLGTIADDGTVLNSRGLHMGSAPGIDKGVAALMFFFPKQTPLPDSNTLKMK